MTDQTQDDIDNEMFRYEEPDDCDCQFADVDILEGRGHCPECGRTWYLTADEMRAELTHQAEYAEAVEDEVARAHGEGKNDD